MGTDKIAAMVRKLDTIASSQFRYQLAGELAREAVKQYRSGFSRQSDPYGSPWPRSKKPSGRTLVATGYMLASGEVSVVTDNGFKLRVYAPYAAFHQTGTRYMPRRMLLPSATQGLGLWFESLNRVASRKVRELLK